MIDLKNRYLQIIQKGRSLNSGILSNIPITKKLSQSFSNKINSMW